MATSAFDVPKMGGGRRASWLENSWVSLKIKAKGEILAFQRCHSAQDLRATRWNRQCIFNLINNLMSQIPPAE